MGNFADDVKQYGSVSAALKANGNVKGEDGSWRKDTSSSSSSSASSSSSSSSKSTGGSGSSGSSGSASSSNRNLNDKGYDPNVDYSLAIRNSSDQAEIEQLKTERQNKIDDMYGGKDPYTTPTVNKTTGQATTPTNTASKYYDSDWTPQNATAESTAEYRETQNTGYQAYVNFLQNQVASGNMSARDADLAWAQAGGTVYYADGTPAWHLSGTGYNTAADLSQSALDKYAQSGDWGAVDEVLNQRKLKAAYEGTTYDAIQDWYEMNQKYGGPSAHLTLEEMYAGADRAYGNTGKAETTVKDTVNPNTQTGTTAPTPGTPGTGLTGGSLGDYLDQWLAAMQQQQANQIDFNTNRAIQDVTRAQQDAEAQLQEQRNQIAIDEAKAKDNQALYAESRGDKGGIGAAQYDSIMNTAAQNRLQVNQAQTQLASDTANQIADLRAQGEYEKADALLELSQQYLSQLINLEQWSLQYGLSVAQFNASLQQWQAEYEMSVASLTGYYNGTPTLATQKYQNDLAMTQQNTASEQGWTLLKAGIMPSASQLSAMGMASEQAQSYIAAAKLSAGSNPKTGSTAGSTDVYRWLYDNGASDAGSAYQLLRNSGYNSTDANKYSSYFEETWYPSNSSRLTNVAEADANAAYNDFKQEASAISAMLQSGKTSAAKDRVNLLWNALSDWEREEMKTLFAKFGVQIS